MLTLIVFLIALEVACFYSKNKYLWKRFLPAIATVFLIPMLFGLDLGFKTFRLTFEMEKTKIFLLVYIIGAYYFKKYMIKNCSFFKHFKQLFSKRYWKLPHKFHPRCFCFIGTIHAVRLIATLCIVSSPLFFSLNIEKVRRGFLVDPKSIIRF